MAELVTISSSLSPIQFQNYSSKDDSLINSVVLSKNYGDVKDYIEGHVYDLNNNLLASNLNKVL